MSLPRRPVAVLLAACLACSTRETPATWHEEAGHRWSELAPARGRSPGFTRLSPEATGIAFANTVSDSAAFRNRHLMHGSGVAIGDVNGDGRADIYLARIEGPNALYLNEGGWRFREAARECGVALDDHPSTGAVLADVDGDSDLDLLVTAMGGQNALFRNDGSGRFTDATAESGLVTAGLGSTTAALADIDGDGDLDLYVANYKATTMLDSLSPQQRAFDQIVKQTGRDFSVIPSRRADYRLEERPEQNGVTLIQRADPDWFYRNDGGGRFVREPLAGNPRFRDESGAPLRMEPEDFGLAARFYDVTGDGAPELYVANDFEDPDQFWINDGTGNFRLIERQAVRRTANSNMAVDFADVDRDGHVDLFQVDMLANDSRRLKTQVPTHTTFAKVLGDYAERSQWQRNALLLNRGDGSFAEIADFAGVAASGWSWSAVFLDVDLDGYEDLLIGNGHTWDLMDADTQERLKSTVTGVDWRQERMFYPALRLANVAFRNRGDLRFEDVSARWRWGTEEDISHGIAAGDLDGDGDQDLVVNRLNAPVAIMRNDATAPRVAVRLVGRAPNSRGIGARVTVLGGAVARQEREVTAGGLYLSGADQLLSFATGAADSVDLEVRWRDGGVTRVNGVRPNRVYEIRESGIGNRESQVPTPGSRLPIPAPLFEDASHLINARHAETRFNDFVRQPLLEFQLSQLGPGVSWIDLDQDGDDDLLVPDGAGGELAWHRNDRGSFVRVPLGLRAGELDFTMGLGFPVGGRPGLLVGRSNYRAKTFPEALQVDRVMRLELGPGGHALRSVPAIGPDTASSGPLALADVDQDGDLDLFVGARVTAAAYPVPPRSALFRNEGGSFLPDSANATAFQAVGMVSGAVFGDVDGDGDPDLALAIDWGPLKLFLNQGGRFSEATEAWGLTRFRGGWKGINAGDFDGDGRLDLVATNWGRNVPFQADSATPLILYVGNFSGTPQVDLIPAMHDPRLGAVAPLASFSRLSWAMPALRRRIPTFAQYAEASIERVIGPAFNRAQRLELTTLEHLVLLNRDNRFVPAPLPAVAQFAPGFAPVVADFDGDGNEDLFLAQNFSQTEVATPRFDAGRGLLLLGDGKGGFTAQTGARSGIVVYGDQRGAAAADFDADGRVDLAVAQNAAELKLYRGAGGKPGLRVRLVGRADNPGAVGAAVRLRYNDGDGPVRVLRSGAGYWSADGLVQVLGLRAEPRAVWVRWPSGRTQEVPLTPGQREVIIQERE